MMIKWKSNAMVWSLLDDTYAYTHTDHATDDDDYNESNGCYSVRTDFYLHYYLQEDYVIIGIGIGIEEKIEFVGIFFFKYKTSLTKTNTFSQFIIAIQMAEIMDFFQSLPLATVVCYMNIQSIINANLKRKHIQVMIRFLYNYDQINKWLLCK